MTYHITSDGAAAVTPDTYWLPIDSNTPRGVKLQLINKPSGVALYGVHTAGNEFFTHWAPAPTFKRGDK